MSARELAVDLSFLRPAEREQLLGELSPQRRAELCALLEEIAGMQKAPAASFEAQLADAESGARIEAFAQLNDGQLRMLLAAEHPSVQRRVLAAVRDGQLAGIAPAVATVITEHLHRRVRANDIHSSGEHVRPRHWWQRWKRTSRK